ncbi:MAG: hypothetical protein ACLTOJ_14175 [[Clostridium] symbiosum]
MAREQFQSLTEQMYYILLALLEPRCGVDISQKAMEISRGECRSGRAPYTRCWQSLRKKI